MGIRIAVVGCGTAGATMVAALATVAPPGPHEIVLVDRPEDRWRGRAYQRDTHAVLANGPMVGMSLHDGDPEHGLRWADARGLAVRPDASGTHRFLPRPVYGEYLCDGVGEALRTLTRRGWRIRRIDETATGLVRRGDTVEISTSSQLLRVDYAVLAPGGHPASDVYGLFGTPSYLGQPYPLQDTLAGVDPDADVTVLGSGMTATDVVVALDARGHRGRITLTSRSGLLPSVRRDAVPVTLRHLSRAAVAAAGTMTLPDLLTRAGAEVREAGGDLDALATDVLHPADPATRLRRQLRTAASDDHGPQVLQRAVIESGQDLWLALTETGQAAVLEHHALLWSFASPIPRSTGEVLARRAATGGLRVRRGLDGAEPGRAGVVLRYGRSRETAGLVLDAITAAGRRNPGPADALVDAARSAGTLVAHPHGGVRIDPSTGRVLGSGGTADDRLFALGELTRGAYYLVSAVAVFTRRAAGIAATIADHSAVAAPAEAA